MQPHTPNLGLLMAELPHAQPFDVKGTRGELEDAAQPVGELLAGSRVSAGQLGQRIALRHEAALAGGQRIGRVSRTLHEGRLPQPPVGLG
jgi:hypothetical protein